MTGNKSQGQTENPSASLPLYLPDNSLLRTTFPIPQDPAQLLPLLLNLPDHSPPLNVIPPFSESLHVTFISPTPIDYKLSTNTSISYNAYILVELKILATIILFIITKK